MTIHSLDRSLYTRWEVSHVVLTSHVGCIGKDIEASPKEPKKSCCEIDPIG